MTSSAPVTSGGLHAHAPRGFRWPRWIADRAPVLVIVLALIVVWYIAAILMNMTLVRDAFERNDTAYSFMDVIAGTLDAERPLVAAPHQIVLQFIDLVFGYPPDSPRSLLYHSWVTLSATFVGFVLGTAFGILLAVLIVHMRVLEKSMLPWIICSQMVPILAVAPIIIVVLGSIGLRGLLPKSLISAYLCFFPVTIGMVKGLTSPDPIQLDLMRTWSATPLQVLWMLRLPASVPFLFTSLKVAITISLVGAIVAELPTGAQAGIGARLLAGSYYGQTLQIWAALLAAALLAAILVGITGWAERWTLRRMGEAMNARPHWGFLGAALLVLAALLLPLGSEAATGLSGHPLLLAATLAAAALFALAAFFPSRPPLGPLMGFAGVILTCAVTIRLLADPGIAGYAGSGFWALVFAGWLAASLVVTGMAALKLRSETLRRANDLAIPLLFGGFLFYLWEVTVRGFGVPSVLVPSPSATAVRFAGSLPTLGEDFVQTFVRGVLTGYAIGCGAGFVVAIIAHRFTFLGRGLLPIGNFVSALPIVGIAPIMVMWFGFDWPSKTAVVAVITFFPMLVNTLAGLAAAGHVERDLMRSYGASPTQTLVKLNLPAAMPFIFNALKINSTLALIGAIVAEFFGTPTRGIGFRISIEVARMSLDMVWAEIALAAIAGMAFYGIVALAERATTFWHPSYRT